MMERSSVSKTDWPWWTYFTDSVHRCPESEYKHPDHECWFAWSEGFGQGALFGLFAGTIGCLIGLFIALLLT